MRCWSPIAILFRFLAALPCITAGSLVPSHCHCGTILLPQYLMVLDWRVSRAGPMLYHWPNLLDSFWSSTIFQFLFFLSFGLYCGAGVLQLIRCLSLLALHCQPLLIILIFFTEHWRSFWKIKIITIFLPNFTIWSPSSHSFQYLYLFK